MEMSFRSIGFERLRFRDSDLEFPEKTVIIGFPVSGHKDFMWVFEALLRLGMILEKLHFLIKTSIH